MPRKTNVTQFVLRKEHIKLYLEGRGENFGLLDTFYILGNGTVVRDDEFYFIAATERTASFFNTLSKKTYQFTTAELTAFIEANGGVVPQGSIFWVKPIRWNADGSVAESVIMVTDPHVTHRL